MTEDKSDLPKLASPARRALAAAGITRLVQLPQINEADLTRLHGIGPYAVKTLRLALEAQDLSFANEDKSEPR